MNPRFATQFCVLLAAAVTLLATSNSQSKPLPSDGSTTKTVSPRSTETAADEAHSFAEYLAVKQALQPYIDAAKSGNGSRMRAAFFDHAHIVGSMNGTFVNVDADTFEGVVNKGGPSLEVAHHIAWIDISGPAAAARIEFTGWLGFRFTDMFILYKHEGRWKISGKVFNAHSKN